MTDLASLEKYTSPLLIPLPPSPPPKSRIPSRKPAGWVSTVPRLSSGRFTAALDRQRGSLEQPKEDERDARTEKRVEGGEESIVARVGDAVSLDLVEWQVGRFQAGGDTQSGQGGPSGVSRSDGQDREGPHARDGSGSGSIVGLSPRPRATPPAPTWQTSSHRRASGSRSASAAAFSAGNKRAVSGTMQYALLPSPPLSPPAPSLLLEAAHQSQEIDQPDPPYTASTTASDRIVTPALTTPALADEDPFIIRHSSPGPDGSVYEYETESEGEHGDINDRTDMYNDTSLDTQDGPDRPEWIDEVLAEREADEEWMRYVRVQLNALFPDFLVDGAGESTPGEQGEGGEGSSAYKEVQQYFGDAAQLSSVHGTERAEREGNQTAAAATAAATAVGLPPLPGVRTEIGQLREEIERLRGVVGGLAEGLKRDQQPQQQQQQQPREAEVAEGQAGGAAQAAAERCRAVISAPVDTAASVVVGPSLPALSGLGQAEKAEIVTEIERDGGEAGKRLLVENSEQVINLIRALDQYLHPRPERTAPEPLSVLLNKTRLWDLMSRLRRLNV